jgi:tetratricopeptide (TPR) repeat protein
MESTTIGFGDGLICAELAEKKWAEGNYAKAEALSRNALEKLRTQVPDNNKAVLNTRILLGRSLVKLDNVKEAEPILRRTMQMFAQSYPGQEEPLAEAKSALGECLVKMRMYGQAEVLMKDSYWVIAEHRGPNHRRTLEARQALADLYTKWGKRDLAAQYGLAPAPRGGPRPVTDLSSGK